MGVGGGQLGVDSGAPAPQYTEGMADQFPLTRVLARDVPGGSRTKGRQYHLDGAVTRLEGSAWSVNATNPVIV